MKILIKLLSLVLLCTSIASCDVLGDEEEYSFELQFRNGTIYCVNSALQYNLTMEDDVRDFIIDTDDIKTEFITIKQSDFIRMKVYDVDNGGALLASGNIPTDGYSTEGTTRLLIRFENCNGPSLTWITL